jgi:hypothetical protein
MTFYDKKYHIWGTKHCKECSRQTKQAFTKFEKVVDGYPELRYINYYCVECSNLTEQLNFKKETNKRSPDFGQTEPQIEFMNQCRYNGENFRNWITLVDQMRNERNKDN